MKFQFFKSSSRPGPSRIKSHHQLKALDLSPALLNDPAFSADPHSHPYNYLTGHDTIWTLPPAPGHPVLKGRRRQRPPKINTNDNNNLSDTESDSPLIQPPNSPVSLDSDDSSGPPTPSYPFHSDSNLSQLASKTILSPPPTQSQPFMASQAAPQKLSQRLRLLTKKRPGNVQPTNESATELSRRSEDGHSRPPKDEPQLQRHRSAPESRRQAERPDLSNRAITSPADIVPNAGSDARPNPHHPQQRLHELDRIDELDETNLFGVPLHHGGPYEAIRAVVGSSARMPLGYPNDGRLHQYHDRTMKAVGHVYMPPEVSIGVPLNLLPGQVLPRNFRRQQAKPPRLRNNLVSPLPVEQPDRPPNQQETTTVPPRYANFNQIPFHSGPQAQTRRQRPQNFDNPLDGPPIDPSVAIGLAMMQIDTRQPSDKVDAPLADKVDEEKKVDNQEFNPYNPKHLGEQAPPSHPLNSATNCSLSACSSSPDQMPSSATELLDDDQLHQPTPYQSIHIPEANDSQSSLDDPTGRDSRSTSPSLRINFSNGGRSAASEETLVQRDDDKGITIDSTVGHSPNHAGVQPVHVESQPIGSDDAHLASPEPEKVPSRELAEGPNFWKSSEQPTRNLDEIDDSQTAMAKVKEPSDSIPDTPRVMNMVDQSLDPEPKPSVSNLRYDKQLPPHPLHFSDPPLREEEATFTPPIILSEKVSKDVGKSPVQKVLQRSDTHSTNRSNRSSMSYQSLSSTRGENGHSSVTSPLSGLPPPLKAQSNSSAAPNPTSMLAQANPMFSVEDFNRYPQPSQRPYAAPAKDQKQGGGVQRPIQRGNSNTSSLQRGSSSSSSQRSSQLSPIQEDVPLPSKSGRRGDLPSACELHRNRILKPEGFSNQGFQSRPPATQPQEAAQRIDVGQYYPQAAQTNNTFGSQFIPNGRPPSYVQQTGMVPPQQHHYAPQSRSQAAPMAMNKMNGTAQSPVTIQSAPKSLSRSSLEERRPLRVMNVLSDVPEVDENADGHATFESHKSSQIREQDRYRDPHRQMPFPRSDVPEIDENVDNLRVFDLHQGSQLRDNEPFRDPRQRPYPLRFENVASSKPASINSYGTAQPMRPQPLHIPKKLVMPTPLKTQNQAVKQSQPYADIFNPRPDPADPSRYQPPLTIQRLGPMYIDREPPPPPVMPPILSQEMRLDPASSAGRKLKKRTTHVPPTPSARSMEIARNTALSFEPVIIPPMTTGRPKPSAEKSKRVLSKKRTNL